MRGFLMTIEREGKSPSACSMAMLRTFSSSTKCCGPNAVSEASAQAK
jgi:hypothetical protein